MLLGALVPLTMAPWYAWPLALAASGGFALLLQKQSAWQCWWRSLWFGCGMFGVGVSWVYVSIHDYGNASPLLAALLTGLFVVGMAAIFALPFFFYSQFNRYTLLTFPAFWLLNEWWRSWFLTGFPWLYLGYGHLDTWLAGWAPIIGVWGVSWIVALTATYLALLVARLTKQSPVTPGKNSAPANSQVAPNDTNTEARPKAGQQSAIQLLPIGIFISLLWLVGAGLSSVSWTQPVHNSAFRVSAIQPAFPLAMKWAPQQRETILNQLRNKTIQLTSNSDLIVWPESAIPALEQDVQPYLSNLHTELAQKNIGLITGIATTNRNNGNYHNSVIGLGTANGRYHKQHLVPFGEYVPLEQWLRGLIAFFDLPMSHFSRGSHQQTPIAFGDTPLGNAICYEIAYPLLVSEQAAQSQVLITLSNDTWFGTSIGPKQHAAIARMRALESGKPLIRATNDGISALMSPKGKITSTIEPFQPGVLSGEVIPYSGKTPFQQIGFFLLAAICISSLLFTKFCRLLPS